MDAWPWSASWGESHCCGLTMPARSVSAGTEAAPSCRLMFTTANYGKALPFLG